MGMMRLSISLDDDLYAIARSLAKAEDCSLSAAVNKLLRRSLTIQESTTGKSKGTFPIVRGSRPVTPDDIARLDADEA